MAERIEVAKTFTLKGYKIQRVISSAQVSNSTWYSQFHRQEESKRSERCGRPIPGYSLKQDGSKVYDEEIVFHLYDYRSKKEFINAGGCRKLSNYIKRDYDYIVNHKKVYRLCKEHQFLLPKKKKSKKVIKRQISRSRKITRPNQLWELDLKYGYIHGENRFFFILVILDIFDRYVVNYFIGLRCKGTDLALTLKKAIEKHKADTQLIVRSDNGSQMTSGAVIDYVSGFREEEVIHEYIPPASPNMNAHIEAFNSILEIEFLSTRYFHTYGHAYEETVEYMHTYNYDRIHGSLKWKTPKEVRQVYLKGGDLGIKDVRV